MSRHGDYERDVWEFLAVVLFNAEVPKVFPTPGQTPEDRAAQSLAVEIVLSQLKSAYNRVQS